MPVFELYYMPAVEDDETDPPERASYLYVSGTIGEGAAGLWNGYGTVFKSSYMESPPPGEEGDPVQKWRYTYPIGHTHLEPTPGEGQGARYRGRKNEEDLGWEYFGGDDSPDLCSFVVDDSIEFEDHRMFRMRHFSRPVATTAPNDDNVPIGWDGSRLLGAEVDVPISIEIDTKLLEKEEYETLKEAAKVQTGRVDIATGRLFLGMTGGRGKKIEDPPPEDEEELRQWYIEQATKGEEDEDFIHELSLYYAKMEPQKLDVGGEVGEVTLPPWHRYDLVCVPKLNEETYLLEPEPIKIRFHPMYQDLEPFD